MSELKMMKFTNLNNVIINLFLFYLKIMIKKTGEKIKIQQLIG